MVEHAEGQGLDAADSDRLTARRRRADAEQNFSRIIEAAVELLDRHPAASVDQIAAAAGVGRATVYRHFSTRTELVEAAMRHALEDPLIGDRDPTVDLAESRDGGPDVFGVVELLNRVPPHLIGEQVVAEARRLAGVSSVALYVVDIDGSRLLRFAGSEEFPAELHAPLAVGPELPREGIPSLRRLVAEQLPGTVAAPLYLRGRAIGLLLAVGARQSSLDTLARQAAAAINLAESYTDVFALSRRRKPISAAAEIQQNLLPPRVVQMSGAALAGTVLPSYDVGGDWFDYAENSDGAWIAVADATGKGAAAASLSALALGAFRAARRSGANLEQAVSAMHEAVSSVSENGAVVTAVIGRWHGPTATFTWINCGHPAPVLITADGELHSLDDVSGKALGSSNGGPNWRPGSARLQAGQRLILYCDGVTERPDQDGAPFGLSGIKNAAAQARSDSAPATIKAIGDAVTAASTKPLEDDATMIVLVPTSGNEESDRDRRERR
jgi:serine phosphatase RsbU (regulator of sigma subunit)